MAGLESPSCLGLVSPWSERVEDAGEPDGMPVLEWKSRVSCSLLRVLLGIGRPSASRLATRPPCQAGRR
jgi:hypothetical protein